ncbi:MAG: EF-hand domain-containing protein [Candidatus Gastranaerophilales bacterium]|nr:EF-hand domain-containing protein [Candidatus Gastranaerophilales bacterium]
MIDTIGTIGNSSVMTPEQMQQRTMMQQISSYDKDKKAGISQAELKNYIFDQEMNNSEAPEFAQKLLEKFSEVDKDKNGQLSATEMGSLVNNKGIWQIDNTAQNAFQKSADGLSISGFAPMSVAPSQGNDSKSLLAQNIQSLVKKGSDYVKNHPEILDKAKDALEKIV